MRIFKIRNQELESFFFCRSDAETQNIIGTPEKKLRRCGSAV